MTELRKKLLNISAVALVVLALAGCATSFDKRGVYHKVRGGESIQRIAKIYRTDVQTLAEYNNIFDAKNIKTGMRLYIPPLRKRAGFKKLPFGDDAKVSRADWRSAKKRGRKAPSQKIKFYRGRFIWPVNGKVTSGFGIRNGRRHDGLDISGKTGTPIKAAAAGKVVFSGAMRGYGKLILVRHKDNMFTAYAHNSRNKVKKGQKVRQGQVIGKVGRTGRATGPHLHFEIRHGQTARNPLFFLPKRG